MSDDLKHFLIGAAIIALFACFASTIALGTMVLTTLLFNPPTIVTFMLVPFVAALAGMAIWNIARDHF